MIVTPPLEDEAILQGIDNEKIEASAEDRAAMEASDKAKAKEIAAQQALITPPLENKKVEEEVSAEDKKLLDACKKNGITMDTLASFNAYKEQVVADVTRKATILGDDTPNASANLTELIALDARYDKMMQKQKISGHTTRTTVESSDGDIARPITQIAKEKV
jgi:hypothetical protein